MILRPSIAAVTFVLLSGAAVAQSVYRCGQTYQDSPCPHGTRVEVGDERSDEQRESARSVAEKEAARADAMERDRLAQERARPLQTAGNIGPQAKPVPRIIEKHRLPPHRIAKRKSAKALTTASKPRSRSPG